MELEDYINNALGLFEMDPADSPYEQGYEDALKEIKRIYFPDKE